MSLRQHGSKGGSRAQKTFVEKPLFSLSEAILAGARYGVTAAPEDTMLADRLMDGQAHEPKTGQPSLQSSASFDLGWRALLERRERALPDSAHGSEASPATRLPRGLDEGAREFISILVQSPRA
jgi:hypothetical protein